MAIFELVLVITLGIVAGFFFYSAAQHRQQQMQMDKAFYELLKAQESCISLIQLAASAKVEAQIARQYLECQTQIFGAVPEVDTEGDIFYRFPKLHLQINSVDKH